jgi:hypothetical protein
VKLKAAVWILAISLAAFNCASSSAIDDIKINVSQDLCGGQGGQDSSYVVYGTNLNAAQAIDATFKYDSSPAQQHFILFDANLDPGTDRFPKSVSRRLNPRETARVGCTYTYRAAPQGSVLSRVPIVISKQAASYVDASTAVPPPPDARAFAAYLLQGGNGECGAGSKPPGLFYLVNLHPFAQLSVSVNLLDERGARVSVLAHTLAAFGATKIGCSNGPSKPGPVIVASLEATAGVAAAVLAPDHLVPPSNDAPALVPLSLGAVIRTQNICAGALPPGWIKVNDAWNPTVCGKPATVGYNVWTIQQFSDEPVGAVLQACKGIVPAGWAVIATSWNPTVCGHPATDERNVVAIKRLN